MENDKLTESGYEMKSISRQLGNRYTVNSAKPYIVILQNPLDTENLGFMNPIAFSKKLVHAGVEFTHSKKID